MNVAVVHNPGAGDRSVNREDICESIAAAGHVVASYASTKDSSWNEHVATDVDLLVVAGGDGTVRRVFTAGLAPRGSTTVLALGTCNNVARTLGVPTDRPLEAAGMWSDAMVDVRYHLPQVVSGRFDGRCVEGAGVGIFAELIRRAKEADADARDPWDLLSEAIDDAPSEQWNVEIDGFDRSGRHLAVIATVVQQTGPNVWISPEADPSRSQLDVVLVRDAQRRDLAEYVQCRRRGQHPTRVAFDVLRGRSLELEAPPRVARSVDDAVLEGGDRSLVVRASDEFVRVLAPPPRGVDG